jgi:hypothetical protein
MSVPKELFKLVKVTNNPKYEGFELVYQPSIFGRWNNTEDLTPGFEQTEENPHEIQTRLKKRLRTIEVSGKISEFNDYPCIDSIFPAFSERACEALIEFLEPNGELLPLRYESENGYYFFNLLTFSDALDVANSKCVFDVSPESHRAKFIELYNFDASKLEGLSIFRIYQHPQDVIVTDEFVQKVKEADLKGFDFIKIWPFATSLDQEKENRKQHVKAVATANLKAQSLILILPIQGGKPRRDEKVHIQQREEELETILKSDAVDEPYHGNYEGNEVVQRAYRMYFSCPNADLLARKLDHWMKTFNWPVEVQLLRRYGDLYNPGAKEKITKFMTKPK